MSCRILVADDHELVRRGIDALFQNNAELRVCASVADGYEAVLKAEKLRPEIIILDSGMPRLNGISAARRILRQYPRQKIILFASAMSNTLVRLALSAGIKGLVFKTDPLCDLLEAVNVVRRGETFFSGKAGNLILAGYLAQERDHGSVTARIHAVAKRELTEREIETTQLLAEGKCSKEIATILGLSLHTAETHRSNLMRKLGIHSVAALVLYSIRNNIIEAPVFDPTPEPQTWTAAAA
jgi:DNA-binding NarL/FixJ family response regulator